MFFTGKYSQLVVMSLLPGEEIGSEVHPEVDQFFRVEEGKAKFIFDETEEYKVSVGDAVLVPAGTRHNIINPSKKKALKPYTLYSPPNHAGGTVHKIKAEAEAAKKLEHQVEPVTEKVKAGRKARTPKRPDSEPVQETKPE